MLMQQVREVTTVNQEMTDESNWIWLTSEQMGFPLRSEFANEITVKTEVRNNATTSVLIKPHVFWRLSSQISFETQKGNSIEIHTGFPPGFFFVFKTCHDVLSTINRDKVSVSVFFTFVTV